MGNHCDINPKIDPEARKCPPVDCNEGTQIGSDAYQVLVDSDNGCLDDCGSSVCASNFRLLKTVHDKCDKDTLSWVAEVAYHDYDEICDQFNCNLVEAGDASTELVCNDPAASSSNSSGPSKVSFLVSLVAMVYF